MSISQSDFDSAKAQLTQALAQADNIRAVIAKKTIRAPFAGRLGIRQINLGQVINDGQAIVTLQSLDPIYVNFSPAPAAAGQDPHRSPGPGNLRCPAGSGCYLPQSPP